MPKRRTILIGSSVAGSFIALAAATIYLSRIEVVSPTQAKLMLVALFGLYLGFGVLIAIYRLMRYLD